MKTTLPLFVRETETITGLRCGGKDTISPSTLKFAPIKS